MGRSAALLLAMLVFGTIPMSVAGQAEDAEGLFADCFERSAAPARCRDAVLAVDALRAGVGLANSLGSDVAGVASTLGWGDLGRPIVAGQVRWSTVRTEAPDVILDGPAPAPSESVTLSSVQGQVTIGVLPGFRSGAFGGILSLDLVGSLGISLVPSGTGFDANEISYGYGARLGILREGFSNPGITLSVSRREFAEIFRVGDTFVDETALAFDPQTTALRLVVGKDWFPFGLTAGAGYDRYDGEVAVGIRPGPPAPTGDEEGPFVDADYTIGRATAFAGAQYTWTIFRLHAEVGWAGGLDALDGFAGEYDPSAATLYFTTGFRLTF